MLAASLLFLLLQDAPATEADEDVWPPDVLTYEVPEGKRPALDDYRFTTWDAGAELYVAEPEVQLLAEPAASSEVTADLALGAPVEVLQSRREPARHQDRVNRWYRVRVLDSTIAAEGWLFGAHLTPFAFDEDLDSDGTKERVTISFTREHKIRVWVMDQGSAAHHIDLEPAGQGYLSQRGGNASASLLEPAVAGIPLIKVDSLPEACADYSNTYLSYDGALRVALDLTGVADPPVHSRFEVRFDPRDRRAVVEQVNEEEDEEGRMHVEKETTRYRLEGGVYLPIP